MIKTTDFKRMIKQPYDSFAGWLSIQSQPNSWCMHSQWDCVLFVKKSSNAIDLFLCCFIITFSVLFSCHQMRSNDISDPKPTNNKQHINQNARTQMCAQFTASHGLKQIALSAEKPECKTAIRLNAIQPPIIVSISNMYRSICGRLRLNGTENASEWQTSENMCQNTRYIDTSKAISMLTRLSGNMWTHRNVALDIPMNVEWCRLPVANTHTHTSYITDNGNFHVWHEKLKLADNRLKRLQTWKWNHKVNFHFDFNFVR